MAGKRIRKIKIGMVGVRQFAAYRRERLKESGLFDIVAVYNRSPEPALELQAREGIRAVPTFEDLLDVKGLEAVAICSGAKYHAEQAIAAAKRGLHVFIEKPLCSTPAEVKALVAVRKKTGVVMGMGHADHRHDAVSRTIKDLIDGGKLGKVATFEKTTAHSGGLLIKPGDWRGDPRKNPGGMLFQCGVHGFHELMYYFGPISEISAMMRYDVHTTKTADVAVCHVRFACGILGTLNAYHVTPYRHTLSIFGTKAALYRDDRFFDEGTKLLMQKVPMKLDGSKEIQTPVALKGKTDHCGNVRSFYEAVRDGGVPYPSVEDGARAVWAVFCAEQSAKKGGRFVKVELP